MSDVKEKKKKKKRYKPVQAQEENNSTGRYVTEIKATIMFWSL